jgi:RNA polymerase sigma-70 factor, ECF subfamily
MPLLELSPPAPASVQSRERPASRVSSTRTQDERTEEDLLLAAAAGDQRAFAELYDLVSAAVYGVVRGVLRDPAQSEEVAQEVFVEVWRAAGRFDPRRGRARSWILTTAHRRAIDRVRSEQASRDRIERVGQQSTWRVYDEVVDEVETRLEYEQVREALTGLTPLQREAVELAYFHGYTYREVAELLGRPLGTIKARIRDGLHQLRGEMGAAA